ncbi:MAG TPA: hypothetical protein VF997_05935 [Polyangia bacterium]
MLSAPLMLRSIIAVWSLALALLIIAATAGCGCDPGGLVATTLPDMAPAAPTCPTSCSGCAAGEICFQPSAVAQLPAFCAHACADDRDCAAGQKCASLFAALQPSVCISDGSPVGCAPASPTWHCDFGPASCKDADTAQLPFSDAVHRVCGWELVHCANGCVTGACR